MNPAIELRDVKYTFPGQSSPVLKGIRFSVAKNESVGIVGQNGSGKSTLLRVVSTLLAPQEGELLFGGRPANDVLRAVRPRIGYSAGAPLGFYPRLTGAENLQLFGGFKGLAISPEQARHLLDKVGLSSAGDLIYFRYSLGMRQRLHLARLCLKPCDYVFVDEPSNGLDQDGLELLVRLFNEDFKDCARIVISHDRALLERMVSRILEIKDGVIVHGS